MNLNIAKLENFVQTNVGVDWQNVWENNMAILIALIVLVSLFLLFLILLFVIFYKNRKLRKRVMKGQGTSKSSQPITKSKEKKSKLSKKEKQKLERQKSEQAEAKESLLEDNAIAKDSQQIFERAKNLGIENPSQYSINRLEQLIMLKEMKGEEISLSENKEENKTVFPIVPTTEKVFEKDQNLEKIKEEAEIEEKTESNEIEIKEEIKNNKEQEFINDVKDNNVLKEESEQFRIEQAKIKLEQEKLDIERKRLEFAKQQAEQESLNKFAENNKLDNSQQTKEVNIDNLESRKEELEQLKKERELIYILKNEKDSLKNELERLRDEKDGLLKKQTRRFHSDELDEEENHLRYLKMMREKNELERLKRENEELNRLRYQRENYHNDYYQKPNNNQSDRYLGDDYYFKHSLDHEFENLKKLQEENLKLARHNSEQIARQQLEREIEEKYKEKYGVMQNNQTLNKSDRIENILLSVENEIEKLGRKVSKIENEIKDENDYLKENNRNNRNNRNKRFNNYDEDDEIIKTIQKELNEINDILSKKKK